ncbi:MAG: IS4 family transposase [Spirochaetaceae bacterium]|nr:IS4 family transposase [Spirochaetaceae bacterium]
MLYNGLVMAQSQISRRLRDEAARKRIVALVSEERFDSRRALGRRVCEEFALVDAAGRLQVAGCMKVLASLAEGSPDLVLPAPQGAPVDNRPRQLAGDVPEPVAVPSHPAKIVDLAVTMIATAAQRALWNTLIAREHPHGLTTFAGCQVRYLVGSAHGWLGAAGFCAAARRVAARERWVAWSEEQRREHLHRVVCLSRFLIRPQVRCPHLASHVLGRILRRLPRDFEARYGFRPWLVESFADAGYDGTCLRAANFVCVGTTAGRGRQDRGKRRAKTRKTVFVYELARSWRNTLGVARVDHAPVREPGEGLNTAQWAHNEFGGAPLGDQRLSARLVKSVDLLAAYPGHKINANSASDRTAINAFYRLIEMPAESQVTVHNILAPHRERSIERMRAQRTVLAIQDGTDLNFTTRPGCDGLQVVGSNQTAAKSLGLHLHATLAVTETGLPLGVLRLGFDPVRSGPALGERKSRRWLDGFTDIVRAVREVGGKTRVLSVCDREADCFELFDAQRRSPRVDLLVRAHHDRILAKRQAKLFATMSAGTPDARIEVEVDALTARPKSSRKKARPARRKRLASCELRFRRVTLPATQVLPGAEPVNVSAVHVVETQPPPDEDPIRWFLLTTLEVRTAGQAGDVVGFYLQRWRVEDFFRVLKSGCRVEFLLFRTAERLQRAIAINAVIAWRIMVMTLLGREVPDCEPHLMFADHELAFLHDYALEHDLTPPSRLGDAVRLVAHLGGYRDRKHDPDPGHQIMWHGQTRLSSAALGHRIGFQAGQRYALTQIR